MHFKNTYETTIVQQQLVQSWDDSGGTRGIAQMPIWSVSPVYIPNILLVFSWHDG